MKSCFYPSGAASLNGPVDHVESRGCHLLMNTYRAGPLAGRQLVSRSPLPSPHAL